jgi:hypothetical protein
MVAEIERELISQRIMEALRFKKAQGMKLGKTGPGKSKLDSYRPEIEWLLANGSTQKFIARRARDLQVPRACPGASAPQRRQQTDVLSVVRKSRNSSSSLYRRRRRSAHDRRRTNARRFLMSALLALVSTAVDSCVSGKTPSGCARTVVLSLCHLRSLSPGIRGYWRATMTAPGLLARVQSCFSKLLLPQYTPSVPPLPLFPAHRSRYSSHALSNTRGRLRPTVE